MAEKANHHFIPQFYLRDFSGGGESRKAKVFCVDTETGKSFTTQVRNVGSRRHFFRVDLDGYDPNHIEDEMSKIEAEISVHLGEVIAAGEFPSDEHFTSIMMLMANVACRNPRFRTTLEDFHKQLAKGLMSASLQTKDRWESLEADAKAAGAPLQDDITYEQMKDFVESGGYDINIDQTFLIGIELQAIEPIIEKLAQRNWCFVTAEEGSAYVTSDDPVVLDWSDGALTPYSPGFGLTNTIVMFPLSPKRALIGMFKDIPSSGWHERDQVAALNTSIARQATKQLYARDGEFELHTRSEQFVKGRDLVASLARERKGRV